jgi:hypothetical protein
MILFLLLLIAAYVLVGVYAYQNTWTHDMWLFQWHWTGVSAWWPVVLTAVAIGALFLLYMIYAGAVHGVRYGSIRRRAATHESTIVDLRRDNTRLREENARLRGELRGVTATPAETMPARAAVPTRDEVARDGAPARDGATAAGYRPQPTVGERVRSFFTGRQPSQY